MSAGSTTVGTIDIIETDASVAPVGVTRLRRKGGVIQQSTDGSAYETPPAGAAATAAQNTGNTVKALVAAEEIAAAECVTILGELASATDTTLPAIGVTVAGAAEDAAIEVVTAGTAAGVLTAATPGDTYYLDTDGTLTDTEPAVGGNLVQVMGYAESATDLFVQISSRGEVP